MCLSISQVLKEGGTRGHGMAIDALLSDLKELGIKILINKDRLGIKPASRVPLDLKERIKQNKAQIIKALSQLPKDACFACKSYNWWLSIYGVWICGVCHPSINKKLIANADGLRILAEERLRIIREIKEAFPGTEILER